MADVNIIHNMGPYFPNFQGKAEIWKQILKQDKDQTKHKLASESFAFNSLKSLLSLKFYCVLFYFTNRVTLI